MRKMMMMISGRDHATLAAMICSLNGSAPLSNGHHLLKQVLEEVEVLQSPQV